MLNQSLFFVFEHLIVKQVYVFKKNCILHLTCAAAVKGRKLASNFGINLKKRNKIK